MPFHQDPDPLQGKSQQLRLFDVFVLAPAMIYVGASGRVPRWLRPFAVLGGLAVAYYNGANYLRYARVRAMLGQ